MSCRLLPLLALVLLAGCNQGPARMSEGARQVHALQDNLHVGMTEKEVVSAIGYPTVFRSGRGLREDVAIYKLKAGTMTVYFSHDQLTRARSNRPPVNR